MTDKPISPYLRNHPIRDLCRCRRGPVKEELGVCEACELDAQANVVDFDKARKFKDLERLMAGDET